MRSDESVFSFDVSPFIKGVERIGKGMDRVATNAKAFGGAITGAIGRGVNSLIVKAGMLLGAFKGLKAVLNEMPEVGEAFGIAKDVFLKNLLWPLRQKVMPLLQEMLDWTRDHRAQFAVWGVAVANVFGAAVTAGKELFKVLSTLAGAIANSFQKTFGTSFKSLDEFINVFSFKVSAIVIYLGMLASETISKLQPVIDWTLGLGRDVVEFFTQLSEVWGRANTAGDSLWTVMDKLKETIRLIGNFISSAVDGFKNGFIPAIQEAMTPLGNLVDEFNRLLRALGFGDSEGVKQAFEAIGRAAGEALIWVLEMGAEIIGFFADLAENWGRANTNGDSLLTVLRSIKTTFNLIASTVLAATKGFREGFIGATRETMTHLQKLVDEFNRLLFALGFGNENGVRQAFKAVGEAAGEALNWVLETGAEIVGFFADLAENWGTSNTEGNSFLTVLRSLKTTFNLLASSVLAAVRGFREGFIGATRETMTPLQKLTDEFNRLLTALGFGDKEGIKQAFVSVGTAAGEALNWVISTGAQIVGFFADLAENWGSANTNGDSLWGVAGKLGEVFRLLAGFVSSAVAGFRKGFVPATREMMTPLSRLVGQFKALLLALGFGDEKGIKQAFEGIGEATGQALSWVLNTGSEILLFFTELADAFLNANTNGDSFWTAVDKLKTTFETLGTFVQNAIIGFREGFGPAVANLMTPVNQVIGAVNRLLDALGFNDEEGVRGAFKAFGSVLGGTLTVGLNSFATAVDLVSTSVIALIRLVSGLWKLLTGDTAGAKQSFKQIADLFKSFGGRTAETWAPFFADLAEGIGSTFDNKTAPSGGGTVSTAPSLIDKLKSAVASAIDSIISLPGNLLTDARNAVRSVIGMEPVPGTSGSGDSTTKFPAVSGGKAPINLSIDSKVDLIVTEGSAKAAGKNFADGFNDRLGKTFNLNLIGAQIREGQ